MGRSLVAWPLFESYAEENRKRLFLDLREVSECVVDAAQPFFEAPLDDDAGELDAPSEEKTHIRTFEAVVQRDAFDLVGNLQLEGRANDA